MNTKNMDAEGFTNLYSKHQMDESIVPLQDEIGFSLVRLYPEDTPYNEDGRRMFIKVAVLDRGFFYEVSMTKPEREGEVTRYIITDGEEYKKRVTNFISNTEDGEFYFDENEQKVVHNKSGIVLTLNEFVDVLVDNHLSDRLFWKRKRNAVANLILKALFWLAGKHYELIRISIDRHHFKRDNRTEVEMQKDAEPFFKYFYISKNILFASLLVTFPTALFFGKKWPLGEFSVSNPTIVLFVFLALFSCEKFSLWLESKIKEFLAQDETIFHERHVNFIEKLHEYQHRNQFELKLR